MKSWLAKFRISKALDSGKRLPPCVRQDITATESMRRFSENSAALEHALRDAPREFEVPPMLHGSIMRSLRAAQGPAGTRTVFPAWRWAPVSALAALVLAGILLRGRLPASVERQQPLTPVASILETGGELSRAVPAAVVAPLTDEWARLRLDLDNTAQFLVANLP